MPVRTATRILPREGGAEDRASRVRSLDARRRCRVRNSSFLPTVPRMSPEARPEALQGRGRHLQDFSARRGQRQAEQGVEVGARLLLRATLNPKTSRGEVAPRPPWLFLLVAPCSGPEEKGCAENEGSATRHFAPDAGEKR